MPRPLLHLRRLGALSPLRAAAPRPRRAPPSRRLAAAAATAAAPPAAEDGYDTVAAEVTVVTEVKKSKFIATAAHAPSPAAALAFVAARADRAARHNCWAYRCGADYRASDDGEPGGTAGRPILAAIEAVKLDETVVLVTRFFGGVKLGAGGLTRAYGAAASAAAKAAPRLRVRPQLRRALRCSFAQRGAVYAALDAAGAARLAEEYDADGATLTLRLQLPASAADALDAALADATSGGVRLQPDDVDEEIS